MSVTRYTANRSRQAGAGGLSRQPLVIAALAVAAVAVLALLLLGRSSGGSEPKPNAAAPAATKDAAIERATQFESTLQTAALDDSGRASEQLLSWSAEAFAPQLERMLDKQAELLAASPLPSAQSEDRDWIARTVPVSHKFQKFGGDRVAVTVWSASIAGIDGVVTPRLSWSRNRLVLEPAGSSWRVVRYDELAPIVPSVLEADAPSDEHSFWTAQEGAEFYDSRP